MRLKALSLFNLAILFASCSAPVQNSAAPDISRISDPDKVTPFLGKTVSLTGTAIHFASDPARPAVEVHDIGRVLLLNAKPWTAKEVNRQITVTGVFINIEAEEPNLAEPMQYPHPEFALKNPVTRFRN